MRDRDMAHRERIEVMAPRYEAALFPVLVLLILVGLVVLGPR